MKLLYRTAEWHGMAKLRMHTESSLALLDELTKEFGELMRKFRDSTCAKYSTVELPKEVAARRRRQNQRVAQKSTTVPSSISNADGSAMNTTPIRGSGAERKCSSRVTFFFCKNLITIALS